MDKYLNNIKDDVRAQNLEGRFKLTLAKEKAAELEELEGPFSKTSFSELAASGSSNAISQDDDEHWIFFYYNKIKIE